jgi:hypothetical protein
LRNFRSKWGTPERATVHDSAQAFVIGRKRTMPPPKNSNIQDVLKKFRIDLSKNAKVLADGAKARDEKIKHKSSTASRRQASQRSRKTKSASKGPAEISSGAKSQEQRWMNDAKEPEDLPLGMRQKQVIDFLRDKEAPASLEEILNATGRNIDAESDLRGALDAHPKIAVDTASGMYSYVPDANVKNKQQLLDFIRASGTPVPVPEVLDSYKRITEDIASLKESKLIIGMYSYQPDLNCEVLYAMDPALCGLEADADVTALWVNFSVPETDEGIDEALQKSDIKPAPRKEKPKRLVSEKKKRRRKQTKLRAVTNMHLMHLLDGEAVTSIDG